MSKNVKHRNLYIIKCFFFIYTPFAVAAVTAGLMCGSTGLTAIIGYKALVKVGKVNKIIRNLGMRSQKRSQALY
jgi:hypothetical protein